MKEIWKDIKNYEGQYQVSSFGKVKSLNYKRSGKEKILSAGRSNTGYLTVVLCNNKNRKTFYIHKLVAEAFINNIKNKSEVNHIDGNKENNCVNNLEFCTTKENIQHAWKKGLCEKLRNNLKLHPNAPKRKVIQYSLNGKFIKKWESLSEAERELNINRGSICFCCKNKIKSAGGYKWRYE